MTKQKKTKSEATIFTEVVLVLGTLYSIIYTIVNRTFDDFLKYSIYISGFTLIFILVIIVIFSYRSISSNLTKDNIIFTLGIIVATLFTGPLYYSIVVAIKDLYFWTQSSAISREWAIVFVLVTTIIFGFSLFFFRLYARGIYGFTEIIAGLGVAAQKVYTEKSLDLTKSSFYFVILTAAIYLVVRGLDNIHQSLTKDPIDPYARNIYLHLFKGKSSTLDDTAANPR